MVVQHLYFKESGFNCQEPALQIWGSDLWLCCLLHIHIYTSAPNGPPSPTLVGPLRMPSERPCFPQRTTQMFKQGPRW
ncbi:mCG147164 [Mus musculus]|nr:mCG147164 [Mus musculus]